MSKALDNPELLKLPACVDTCDVCEYGPVDIWLAGFGCDHCRGEAAVIHATELSWGGHAKDRS
jgi:hypothetical protein